MIRLRSRARDSNVMWPNCDHDLSSIYIKNRFIWGKSNDVSQADILAKEWSLKTLEHRCEPHRSIWDGHSRPKQDAVHCRTLDVNISLTKTDTSHRETINNNGPCLITTWNYDDNIAGTWFHCNACKGCGSYQYGSSRTNNWQRLCVASG